MGQLKANNRIWINPKSKELKLNLSWIFPQLLDEKIVLLQVWMVEQNTEILCLCYSWQGWQWRGDWWKTGCSSHSQHESPACTWLCPPTPSVSVHGNLREGILYGLHVQKHSIDESFSIKIACVYLITTITFHWNKFKVP